MSLTRYLPGAALCALIGFNAAQTRESNPAPVDEPPRLAIEISRSGVVFRGVVSSVAHESILRQRALALFPDRTQTFHVREQPALPPGWALLSEVTLRAVAESYSSTTQISETLISITGITSSQSDWQAGLARIEKNLLPGMSVVHEMAEIGLLDSHEEQCARLFAETTSNQSVEFPQSATSLGSSAHPFLDELIQIAVDCPTAHFSITGHTDGTGEEVSNIAISRERAEAVAAYMRSGGIQQSRITVSGAGSARPLTDGRSRQDRQRNRRIEIEMDFPES